MSGQSLSERWEAGRAERDARRSSQSAVGRWTVGLLSVAAVVLVCLVGLALVALLIWFLVAEWKILLGAAVGIAVVCAVAIGIRRR